MTMPAIYKDCVEPYITLTCNDIDCIKGGQGTETQAQIRESRTIGQDGWRREIPPGWRIEVGPFVWADFSEFDY